MSYTALARRYRSQSFSQVIGQEPIAQTLANAIATGRTHHAYLFCGTRGVGKTSMARLFARALNAPDTIEDCPKPPDHDQYPPLDVQQRMAEAIMRGDDLNVIEIDAASNTGVDNVRDLIANAALAPTDNARYKVYIIDEVHMLSKSAFNALLKIMEEPPAHVKFILCTTEPVKVLPTIHSRCQRFDFRHIPTALIEKHLADLLEREQVQAEPGVTFELARLGNGSMRDALSVLDRMLATGQNPLTMDLLEKMLGLAPRERLGRLIDAIAEANVASALEQVDQLLAAGTSQEQLVAALTDYLRQLMLVAACGADSELVEVGQEARQRLAEQARQFDVPALIHMIALCEHMQRSARDSAVPRALLDATIARLALSEQFGSIAALAAGVSKKKVVAERPAPAARAAPERPAAGPEGGEQAARGGRPEDGGGESKPGGADVPQEQMLWPAVVEAAGERPSMSWVNDLELVAVEGRQVRLRVRPHVHQRVRFMMSQTATMESLLAKATGRRLKVVIEPPRRDGGQGKAESEAPGASGPRRLSRAQMDQAMQLPLVRQVMQLFDARLVDLQVVEQEAENRQADRD